MESIPIATILTTLVDQVNKTAQAAKDIDFQEDCFRVLSNHLFDIELFLRELQLQELNDSRKARQALEFLEADVKKANDLVEKYTNQPHFYLLIKCQHIVEEVEDVTKDIGWSVAALSGADTEVLSGISKQVNRLQDEMLRQEYVASPSRLQIVDKLNKGLIGKKHDQEFANYMIKEIAKAVGLEPPGISKELESLRREREEVANSKERDEDIFLDRVIELLNYEEIRKQYFQRVQVIDGYDPREEYIPPFKAFICPISGTVMDDPVSLCTGTACERTALEDWFKRGDKTDPETGFPLEDFSYRPNVQLRQSIQEWKELNYCLKIRSCKAKLVSDIESSVVAALDQMQQLMSENSINKDWISIGGLIDITVSILESSHNRDVKEKILVTLKDVVEGNPRNKNEVVESKGLDKIIPCLGVASEAAVELLYELLQDRSGWYATARQKLVRRTLSHGVQEMELEHFSHEHPLIFEEEHKDDGTGVSCFGCQQPISGPCYNCKQCKHSCLHKVCAELPKEMKHPMHPQHPLILLPTPPYSSEQKTLPYSQSPRECSACEKPLKGFTYNCSICMFNVDIFCALMVQKIELECHKHPLTPLERSILFLCDACGTRHEGTSYQCTTCQFWVNQKCASLPTTIEYGHHKHLLSLTYSFPYEHFKFKAYCRICTEKVDTAFWAYYCTDCKYFAHVNCVTSKAKLSSNQETEISIEKLDRFLIGLPLPDESINPITHCVKKIGLRGDGKKGTKIYHVSHHHPLTFAVREINDESCSTTKLLACDGCTQPVSGPLYHCTECNFILHDCCAKLPIELQHPVHADHPLILNSWQSIYSDLPLCQGCKMSCNGVLYGCVACDFFLDIKCASLLGNIFHQAHQHFVTLGETTGGLCSACQNSIYGVGLVCDICKFKLHTRCALLPPMVRHRYDKHPFRLTFSGNQDEYYCEICEAEINPQCWFYHCDDCNQSLDGECILLGTEVISLPQRCITHKDHEHSLALMETINVKCAACKHSCYGVGFVCDSCSFTLHARCASLPYTVRYGYDKHPFFLTTGNQDKCFCGICKGVIDTNCWFYYCGNQSIYTVCFQIKEYSNIKTRDKLNVGDHPHLLTYVEHTKDISPCDNCGELVKDWGFECVPCNFRLHMPCACNAANQRILLLQQEGKLAPVDEERSVQDMEKWLQQDVRDAAYVQPLYLDGD